MDNASRSPLLLPPPPPSPSSPPPITTITRSPLSNRSNLELTSWDFKDSSEGQPSSHESLYDAGRVSTSDRAKSPYQTATLARPVTPPPAPPWPIDLDSESPLSRLETPFLYGRGTELAPIIEQRSIATLRTGSLSASDVSSLMHGAPPSSSSRRPINENNNNNNDGSLRTPLQIRRCQQRLRRRQSFSLDDLPLVYPTHQQDDDDDDDDDDDAESVTSAGSPPPTGHPHLGPLVYTQPAVQAADVHAYPQRPLYPAHEEPRTPPGLATLIQQRQQRLQPESRESPSFRGQRSGHGDLASHPFVRLAGRDRDRDRRPFVVASSSTSAFASATGRQHAHPYPRANATATTATAIPGLRARHQRSRSSTRDGGGSGDYSNSNSLLRLHLHLPAPFSSHSLPHTRENSTSASASASASAFTSASRLHLHLRPVLHLRTASTSASPSIPHTIPHPSPDHHNTTPNNHNQPQQCRSCHRPADEWWSLSRTVAGGEGPGARRGGEWCTRCAYRKVARAWCFCCYGDGGGDGGSEGEGEQEGVLYI